MRVWPLIFLFVAGCIDDSGVPTPQWHDEDLASQDLVAHLDLASSDLAVAVDLSTPTVVDLKPVHDLEPITDLLEKNDLKLCAPVADSCTGNTICCTSNGFCYNGKCCQRVINGGPCPVTDAGVGLTRTCTWCGSVFEDCTACH